MPRRIRRRFFYLLGLVMPPRPRVAAAVGLGLLPACVSPMSSGAKLNDAVQEMNVAARFGRTDIAGDRVAPGAPRAGFAKRHRAWGSGVRIADVELGSVEKMTGKEAVVLVAYSWFRPDEGRLCSTLVRQTWRNDRGGDGWLLVDEERAAGEIGLLDEPGVVRLAPPREHARFETKVIQER